MSNLAFGGENVPLAAAPSLPTNFAELIPFVIPPPPFGLGVNMEGLDWDGGQEIVGGLLCQAGYSLSDIGNSNFRSRLLFMPDFYLEMEFCYISNPGG